MSVEPTTTGVEITQDDRTMAMLAYILGIFSWFVGPLVIWLIKKDQSRFVAYHGMQALILWAAMLICMIACHMVLLFIGYMIGGIFWIVGLVFSIIAGMAANRGEWYELPVIGKFARQQAGI